MKKIAVIVLGVLVFGCGASKRSAQTQKDRDTTRVVIDKRTTGTTPTNTDAVKEAEVPKTTNYASPTEAYIAQYSGIAQEEMKLYGIPASITLAQGILESGSGKGRLSVQANNHFGIKCHEWTGERIYHDDDRRQECFRKYNHSKYSYRDHSLFLKERKRYRGLFDLKIDDYKGWARGLKAAGYATDRKYPDKLISLIERYQLHRFDHEVMGAAPRTVVSSHVKTGAKYVVEKGDTLYSISKKFNLTVERLQQLNNIKGTTIDVGQVLVVNQ
ncbi:N-acetylmuramidase [Mangrovimonas yunxiaonensis]|uniref:Peptidoglycan hydrolase n=1 Tax=Mangrovimonas yunxiaonensis TaxID=1197477 RepID=A0A084TNZ8_9FLAO|nr:glucosaminidase domain-containing protein [Mangrovimonas yunxiaonensis]KFB02434.1 N-acetylmuramidase [Mangrovimonas yunxiaonensis]GGH40325.1 hemagglutinin [Mangrovimonas yunxiaonensis]